MISCVPSPNAYTLDDDETRQKNSDKHSAYKRAEWESNPLSTATSKVFCLKVLKADQDIILLSWDDLLFPFISQAPGFTLMEVFLTLLPSWTSEMVLMMCSI